MEKSVRDCLISVQTVSEAAEQVKNILVLFVLSLNIALKIIGLFFFVTLHLDNATFEIIIP